MTVEVSNPTISANHNVSHTQKENNLDIPIALRKATRTCTKHPLHLFLSYKNLSRSHKAFLTSLNNIAITKTLSAALRDENWRHATKAENGGSREE